MYSDKEELECDVECYVNYFLIKFRQDSTGKMMEFEQYEGKTFNRATVLRLMQQYKIITFNGKNYDFPMIVLALKGATCEELKKASDAIVKGKLKSWQFEKQFNVRIPPKWDHIDLQEPAPGVMISLKLYMARLGLKKLQELPFEEDAVITPEQRPVIRQYCGNDLIGTAALKNAIREPLNYRDQMSVEYEIDLRSKSDAQIAEAVIKKKVSQLLGCDIAHPYVEPNMAFAVKVPAFVSFRTKELRDLTFDIKETIFYTSAAGRPVIPKVLASRKIKVGVSTFKMGIGGLHSTEKSVSHVADDDHEIHDDDADSFYPYLIVVCGMSPKQMGGHFQNVYSDILKKRLLAKDTGNSILAQLLKIVLNGTYGKLGSPYSIFYAPDLLLQVTITGQLVMLMLIEMFESAGIHVISANTDGIVTKVPRHLVGTKQAIIKAWEQMTGFRTSNTRYRAVYSRDVNSYLAIKLDGKLKPKGAFAETALTKSPANEIIQSAVSEFLSKGTPIETTICQSRDITLFVSARRVNGGALMNGEFVGKTCRWYRSINSDSHLEYKTTGNKVPLSDKARPVMDLPDEFPDDIDYGWYIREAYDLLSECGYGPKRVKQTVEQEDVFEEEVEMEDA